ncbi:hypothetical protein BDW22DRAFT_928472 [Trametopsis cervina]|nr:hypothetical protein BDW22DRAFT_928472 [Trametopsis cervina]
MSTPTPTLAATEESLRDIVATKYFFLASLTMMLYDHALTFPQEVQVIWKRKKTYISYLFFLVRYYSVLAMIVITFGFFSPELTREDCSHWMLFLPLGCTLVLTLLPGILMSIRVSAVYNGNPYLLCGLLTLLAAQAGAGLWQYTVKGGTPAPDPVDNYNFHFCIYLPPKSLGTRSIMYISMEVAFDSLVFLLTVARTTYLFLARTPRARLHREEGGGGTGSTGSEGQGSSLLLNLVRDGVFYFGAIFSINLAWVIMILHAPTGLRATAAIPGGCFMATMICRITINLRTTAYGPARLDEL